jgi:hypothetical protein
MLVTFITVKRIIDDWDPVDLLITHAPSDEYDGESKEIFAVIGNNSNIEIGKLSCLIHSIFTNAFGNDVFKQTKEDCEVIAKRLLLQ